MAEQSALRNKVSSLQIDASTDNSVCSSLFVEPVEWMGPLILGHKDGKVTSDSSITERPYKL